MHIGYHDYKSSVAAPNTGWCLFFIGHVYSNNYSRLLTTVYKRVGEYEVQPMLNEIKRKRAI